MASARGACRPANLHVAAELAGAQPQVHRGPRDQRESAAPQLLTQLDALPAASARPLDEYRNGCDRVCVCDMCVVHTCVYVCVRAAAPFRKRGLQLCLRLPKLTAVPGDLTAQCFVII
jgi:hypothetical protein